MLVVCQYGSTILYTYFILFHPQGNLLAELLIMNNMFFLGVQLERVIPTEKHVQFPSRHRYTGEICRLCDILGGPHSFPTNGAL